MKKLIILLFISNVAIAQDDYIYVKGAFDLNNATGLIDNPRTETQTNGLDFDAEVGARYKRIAVYITYGRFENIGYQNYAAGVDYHVGIFKYVETSIGFNYGVVMRRNDNYYFSEFDPINEPVWGGSGAIAFRATLGIPIARNLSVSLTSQFQQRPELQQFVFEGSVGLKYQFNLKKWN